MKIRAWSVSSIIILWLAAACGPGNGSTRRTPPGLSAPAKITTLEAPDMALTVPVGTGIPVRISHPDSVAVDSIQVFLGGVLKRTIKDTVAATVSTSGASTGNSGLRLRIFFADGTNESQSRPVTFLSDIEPVDYSYKVVRTYPHNEDAYTQGLEYHEGWLYEGTGNYGTSSVRKVDLETGEVVKRRDLDPSLFGEGITVFDRKIYQVTYKSQVGFVYDLETFEEIRKIYYQNREGWGLTNNGEELIMSDGTHVIYFVDPELFTVNRQIEVYDTEGAVGNLNELEFIRGRIWANRYYTDEIVIIDPQTGKLEGRLNLKGILKATDRKPTTDVLNGIAWDRERERIFVTGKFWPKLFEIRLTEPR